MFLVVAIEVEKGGQVKMVENGRKWQAIDFHGYLVGNGFPRIIRHSPTTRDIFLNICNRFEEKIANISHCQCECQRKKGRTC